MNIRQEAYNTIVKVLKNNDFSDTLLHQNAKKLRANNESIAMYYSLVKGVIKMHGRLDYIISRFTDPVKYQNTDIKIKSLLYIGLYQLIYMNSIPDHAALNETVELAKSLFGNPVGDFVNAILRNYLRDPEIEFPKSTAERIASEHSYPIELVKKWLDLWGEENTEYLALYFNESPELHIRVNTTATTPEKLLQYFSKRDIHIEPSNASTLMFTSTLSDELLNDVAFSEGYFSVQDTSAALVVELLDPQPEESILDLFAAPGGKCTYIAELMKNTGEVIAVDKIPNKVKLIKQAAERLQLYNIRLVTTDAFRYGPVAPAFNRVLVDAPCSGWGVFGRKADLRWQKHNDLTELIKIQEKALDLASSFVKVGGYMVYSTCTLNPDENENQIASFLRKNTKFKIVPASDKLMDSFVDGNYFKTIPFKHNMDGAFAAKLQRIG